MAIGTIYNLPYRRQRQGRTNYKKRLQMLISKTPRLIVRRTNSHVILQLAQYTQKGDRILAAAHSLELKKHGWTAATGNLSAAYLTGLLLGSRAVKAGVTNAIADFGLQTAHHGGGLFAALKGAIDGGLTVPVNPDAFPDGSRLLGAHIESYAKTAPKGNAGGLYGKTREAASGMTALVAKVAKAISPSVTLPTPTKREGKHDKKDAANAAKDGAKAHAPAPKGDEKGAGQKQKEASHKAKPAKPSADEN